ncbi:MAG: endonuclease III [Pseudomonadota bacterium]|nr:endonuclease III [Pseudomonadota bacterium]MEC8461204.1 endonuclease III [Pseudomonadota bacterium]
MISKNNIAKVFRVWAHENPHPEGELAYSNHYQLLVAVVLSAQATDISVNKATSTLFKKISTPQDMLDFSEDRLILSIKSIGLYRSKAKHVMQLSALLINQYDGIVPNKFEDLIQLPGVGRKTANVVLNMAFGQATIAVDTHVYRVSRRLGFSKGTTELKVEQDLLKVVPSTFLKHAHHWMILHGRYVCKARSPLCLSCSVAQFCRSKDKTCSS